MSDDLYERDILEWSERQADLLRRVAAGERRNDVDWPNVIEEIADVGSSVLTAVRSFLRQAMVHLIKIHASPNDLAREHWLDEIETFLDEAEERFSPSMRQRIDIDAIYRKAVSSLRRRGSPVQMPASCPWSLDDLLAADINALLTALTASTSPSPTP